VSRLEDLPPDLRAVLSLLLRQRQDYAAIAGMLGIEERAVRDRAHAALALLAPRQARELTAAQREQVGEYLLSHQTPEQALATWALLEDSPSAQAWAQALSDELAPLAAEPLPAISIEDRPGPSPSRLPSSRMGGAIVLGVLAVIVIVGVLLIVGVAGGGGGSHGSTGSSASSTGPAHTTSTPAHTTSTGSTTSTSSKGPKPHIGKPLQLTPPEPGASKAVGIAYVLIEGPKRAFYLIAQGLTTPPKGAFYAVWLENSPTAAVALGSLPPLSSGGHTEGGGALPANAGSFSHIVVTLETEGHPTHPGTVALSGPFTLG
jgi:Anti-sigma-K factor rskA, C-terminal